MPKCLKCKNLILTKGNFVHDGSFETQQAYANSQILETNEVFEINIRKFCKIYHSFMCITNKVEECSDFIFNKKQNEEQGAYNNEEF